LLAIYALPDDPGLHWHPDRKRWEKKRRKGKGNAISGAILSKHSSKNGN